MTLFLQLERLIRPMDLSRADEALLHPPATPLTAT